ncbi:MAG: GalNAc(5)-diNAcBac-PP-undecaprenol beta-1,3-glucosyltransferase [Syntrophorhabdus sp. PtaU1.Bin058]|nr:MAG: GalNAc(5)-diNAcBac-PP-undecaprenol beta-1,3-glucosyltransferase [Syntrophorhabdus sp. PtaU1.Bin058]
MDALTLVIPYSPGSSFVETLSGFVASDLISSVGVVCDRPIDLSVPRCNAVVAGPIVSGETLNKILSGIRTKYLLLVPGYRQVSLEAGAIERLIGEAESTGAGIVYSDYYDKGGKGRTLHPLNNYQLGSVRDDFDFGAMMLFSAAAVREAVNKYGAVPDVRYAGLYDLRLKVSIDNPIHHVAEPLYSVVAPGGHPGGEKHFAYVDPRNEALQKEMEAVFTDYLKKAGAYLLPGDLKRVGQTSLAFPVEASVIIPVLNRQGTVADAVRSALSQETDFPFNVIVVDNHSTDGTTDVLAGLARKDPRLKHMVPERRDLGIGGCWNEALYSGACGRYAIQLDSDDLYSGQRVLKRIVDMLREGRYAMVIGSYTIVNERLEEMPPGLIDHREWTDANGHNNALRINGLGAPRAFDTGVMRDIGFMNVSYGEDYAAALRICREYRIGRIYESLYLCRRWPGNTDAALTIEAANRNDAFKDRIRTDEMIARRKMNSGRPFNAMG